MNKVFIALLLVTALAAIEGTIVSTAIPSITADLLGVDLISWIYSAYLLASAIAAIIFGKLADLFGRKRMIITGIIIFSRFYVMWFSSIHGAINCFSSNSRYWRRFNFTDYINNGW